MVVPTPVLPKYSYSILKGKKYLSMARNVNRPSGLKLLEYKVARLSTNLTNLQSSPNTVHNLGL